MFKTDKRLFKEVKRMDLITLQGELPPEIAAESGLKKFIK
jgi:hypothetical protein